MIIKEVRLFTSFIMPTISLILSLISVYLSQYIGSNKDINHIYQHIKHILEEGELDENSVVRNFRTTANDNKSYNVKYYNLDMIVAVEFRARSNIGTNFRKWANEKLTKYMTKGFTMNDELLARIRDIRLSEKGFCKRYSCRLDIHYCPNCGM